MAQASKLSALLTDACGHGDPAAQERAFEEVFRLLSIFVRSSMGEALRRHRESVDVCQTVARSLVGDMRAGKLSFPNEAALVGYLQTVVRTKLAELARRDRALKRGGPGAAVEGPARAAVGSISEVAAGDPTASQHADLDERLGRALGGITPEEMELIRLRRTGMDWDQISAHTGRSSGALRKQWSRLVERAGSEADSLDAPG